MTAHCRFWTWRAISSSLIWQGRQTITNGRVNQGCTCLPCSTQRGKTNQTSPPGVTMSAEREEGTGQRRMEPLLGSSRPIAPPSLCCCKPEPARAIQMQILWPEGTTMQRGKREGAKGLLPGIKAPDVVGVLLGEPGITLWVNDGGHDAILRPGRGPAGHDSRVQVEAIGIHLAHPGRALPVHGWLHQADVRALLISVSVSSPRGIVILRVVVMITSPYFCLEKTCPGF